MSREATRTDFALRDLRRSYAQQRRSGFRDLATPHAAGRGPPYAITARQSPRVSNEALPPAAVVLTVTVFSVAKRGR